MPPQNLHRIRQRKPRGDDGGALPRGDGVVEVGDRIWDIAYRCSVPSARPRPLLFLGRGFSCCSCRRPSRPPRCLRALGTRWAICPLDACSLCLFEGGPACHVVANRVAHEILSIFSRWAGPTFIVPSCRLHGCGCRLRCCLCCDRPSREKRTYVAILRHQKKWCRRCRWYRPGGVDSAGLVV